MSYAYKPRTCKTPFAPAATSESSIPTESTDVSEYVLDKLRFAKDKAVRERIQGEFCSSFFAEHGRHPTPAQVTKYTWGVELAGKAPIDRRALTKLAYESVFNRPYFNRDEQCRLIARNLRVTSPKHLVEVEEVVDHVIMIRQELVHLVRGEFGHERDDVATWIADMAEFYVAKAGYEDEQHESANQLVELISDRLGAGDETCNYAVN